MRKVLLLVLLLLATAVALVTMAVEPEPAVAPPSSLRHEDVGRIRDLLRRNDPRRLRDGERSEIEIAERDLNLALHHALARFPFIAARVEMRPDSADVVATLILPSNPFGSYLNGSGRLVGDRPDGLVFERLSIGRIGVPLWVANGALEITRRLLRQQEEYRQAIAAIEQIHFAQRKIRVVYRWTPEIAGSLPASGSTLLFPEEDRVRMAVYAVRLREVISPLGRSESVARALPPLFAEARERSREEDPVAENRALLWALGLWAAGPRLAALVDGRAAPPPMRLALRGRGDLARHFLVSAAATAATSSGLANAAGLFKELDDSMGGSGFSFVDLAADFAGVRLGREATGSVEGARRLQERLSERLWEDDFMPSVDGLAEGLSEEEFRRRYRDPESSEYRRVVAEIERRVAACALYR